jgi:hypothetical protein
MLPKILQDTLRQADGGNVTCSLLTDNGRITGIIEKSFFEDFASTIGAELTHAKRLRIVAENMSFLEGEAAKQLSLGYREVVIR